MHEDSAFEECLRELGFSKNESRVYLALLEIGSSNVGRVAARSGVYRTNVYDALEGLVKKGLSSFVVKKGVKYFEAINPEALLEILRERESKLVKILPLLKEKHTIKEEVARTWRKAKATREINA